jgi:SAM-dependent methyltransferase
MDKMSEEIRAANNLRYETPDEVARYTQERYHRVRLDLASGLMSRCLALDPSWVVADIGAGGPQFANRLSPRGIRVVVIDIEAEACQAVRPLPAVRADAAFSFPLRDAAVAGLFMGELIEHIYDTDRLLAECHRVLRPGGCLVLTTPNLAGLQDRANFIVGRSPRHVDAFHEYLRLHIRQFTRSSLRTALTRYGFEPFEIDGNHVAFRWRNGRRVRLRWAARIFPGLAGSLIAGAIKR